MGQYAFAVDSAACSGCKTCQVACQEAHDLPAAIAWRQVHQYGGGTWTAGEDGVYAPEGIFRYFLSISCNHCANPACVETCPTGAMQKSADTGVVNSDPNVCIGCGTCVESCPYGAPHLDEEAGHVTKCDMCQALVEAGEQPACVESCPTRALYFGELAELAERFPGTDALIEPLPETDTAPSLFVLPHKDAQRSGAGTGAVIFAVDEV